MSGLKHQEMIVDYMICECGDLAYYDNHGSLVRCKDCRFFKGDTRGTFCDNMQGIAFLNYVKEADYCSFGKRSDSEEEKDG